MGHLIALRGKANVGKSETLRIVRDALLERYPDAGQELKSRSGKVDFRLLLTVKGRKIGIESQGDPGSRLKKNLELFMREHCDIVVCATRTYGQTVKTVEQLSASYKIDWVLKNRPSAELAREIVAKIEELLRTSQNADFVTVIEEWVGLFDKHFEATRVPIPDRPFLAASGVVEHAIERIEGASKDDLFAGPWFRHIMKPVQRWYSQRYGDALRHREHTLLGVVDALGAYFLIDVPTNITRPNDGDTFWAVFPTTVLQPEEDPTTWIQRPPRLESLDQAARESIVEKVISTGVRLRTIHMDFSSGDRSDDHSRDLSRAVMSHLAAAARIIENHRESPVGVACWEAHQAVEKALKLMARKKNVKYPKTHDLVSLYHLVRNYLPEINTQPLSVLPDKDRVIEMRMGEGADISANEAFGVYQAALEIVASIGPSIPRELYLNNAAFLLRKLPW